MVDFFRNWCEELVVGIFIIIIIEMFIPTGNIKKYVKVVAGIYIIFIVLNPVISNIKDINFQDILENSENYSKLNYSSSQEEMENLYAKAIVTEIEKKFSNIENAQVLFTEDLEDIEKIEITFFSEAGNTDEIKEFLMENYSVSSGRIVWLTN